MSAPARRALLLALLLGGAGAAPAGDLGEARDAAGGGAEAAAPAQLRALAEAGDARAQEALAGMYLGGRGVERDVHRAMQWLCLLAHHAEGGPRVARALWYLATYFRTGGGYPGAQHLGDPAREDPIRAYFWYALQARQAALFERGERASILLGRMGRDAEARMLIQDEAARVDAAVARWKPDRAVASGAACLALPEGLMPDP